MYVRPPIRKNANVMYGAMSFTRFIRQATTFFMSCNGSPVSAEEAEARKTRTITANKPYFTVIKLPFQFNKEMKGRVPVGSDKFSH